MNIKIVAESTYTLKMNNGSLLRKPGVAVRKASTPKKRTLGITKPPTPADLRKKIAIADSKKRKKSGTLAKQGGAITIDEQALQESVSDSDSQSLATKRIGGKLPLAQLPEIQAEPNEGSTVTMREGRSVTELANLEKSAGEQNEKASTSATEKGSGKSTKNSEEDGIPAATEITVPAAGGKKKRAAKQRLVSYSSLDSESDTTSRKSSRKRTVVTKMGGVMIGHISRGGVHEKGDE